MSDHGIARLEGVLEEALQDLPSLVHEIQERLRSELYSTVAHCAHSNRCSSYAASDMVLSPVVSLCSSVRVSCG